MKNLIESANRHMPKSTRTYSKYVPYIEHLIELFTEYDENPSDNKRQDVIKLIQSGDLKTDTITFKTSLNKSKHPDMLTDYDEGDFNKMKLFKVPGYNIGYALKQYKDPNGVNKGFGELVAVHNNEPEVKGIGEVLIKSAIENGATFLDHFDVPQLTNLYSKLGFKEFNRDDYDPDGTFKAKYGEVPVIYRKLT